MLGVLRIGDFRLLLTSQFLSNTGDWLLMVAAPFFVFELTGSTMATGLTLTAESVPAILLGPIAGVFADRWDRRRIMIATDLLRAATVLSMLAVHSRGGVWIVYAALTLEAGFGQFFNPARGALIPSIIGRGPELSAANALSQLVGGVIRLVGGPLGGALYVFFGFHIVVALDVASYLLSAALTLPIRHRAEPRAARPPSSPLRAFRTDLRAGLSHLRHSPDLRVLFVIAALFFTGNAMLTALLVPYLGGVLHAGAQSLGILFGALGAGFVLGGPLSRLVADRLSDRITIVASLLALAAVFAASFNTPHLAWDLALFTLIGPPAVCFLVTADTAVARRTPDEIQGRVGSVYLALQGAATLTGMLGGSILGEHLGVVTTMNLAAALIAASAPVILLGHRPSAGGRVRRMFSPVVTDFWRESFADGNVVSREGAFSIAVNADLREDRQLMVLTTPDRVRAVLSPALAEVLGRSSDAAPMSEAGFREALREAGLTLHDADNLFYYAQDDLQELLRQEPNTSVRQLTEADAALFDVFTASASEQDLDDAYVELDHWAVFGAFADDRLVSAASMYPWGGAKVADLGVMTLPDYRGRGHARAVVRASYKYAAEQGYQPQYRCQLDNHASVALAKAAGLTHFGTWEPISTEDPS
ncbi:MAG TPA: MFS transporter [Actinospica sp.]|jgi:MFS family permease/RimJ/RimL family protein N-acetyltransferase|nr:MFS transporter [Actinospica sp.]